MTTTEKIINRIRALESIFTRFDLIKLQVHFQSIENEPEKVGKLKFVEKLLYLIFFPFNS